MLDRITPFTLWNVSERTTALERGTAISEEDTCMRLEGDPSAQWVRFIGNGVLLNGCGTLGIVGNIVSMVILGQPQMRTSTNYLLIGLARIDTALIITSMLLFGLTGLYPFCSKMFTYYYVIYPHIAPLLYPIATAAQTASVYLTLTVSIERYVAVCHPLRARTLCTYGRARGYVAAVVILAALYNVPKLLEADIRSEWYGPGNVTIYCPRPSHIRDNHLYKTIYIHWMYLIFLYLIPFTGLALINAAIYRQVRLANRERQHLSRHQRREIGLATMLLCVVAVFFVSNVLALVINIIDTFEFHVDLSVLVVVSNLLVTLNSSVNFIIYVIFGKKFRRLFVVYFCHGQCGQRPRDGATMDRSVHGFADTSSIDGTSTQAHWSMRHFSTLRKTWSRRHKNGTTAIRRPAPIINPSSPDNGVNVKADGCVCCHHADVTTNTMLMVTVQPEPDAISSQITVLADHD